MNLSAFGVIVDRRSTSVTPVLFSAVVAAALSNILVIPPHIVARPNTTRVSCDEDSATEVGTYTVTNSQMWHSASAGTG